MTQYTHKAFSKLHEKAILEEGSLLAYQRDYAIEFGKY